MRIKFPLVCLLMIFEIFLNAACDGNREAHRERIASESETFSSSNSERGADREAEIVPRSFVSVSGYVRKADGTAIPNARLHISGGDIEGPIFEFTDPSGRFEFTEVATGASYRIAVRANPQIFKIDNRTVTVDHAISDIEFVAQPTAAVVR